MVSLHHARRSVPKSVKSWDPINHSSDNVEFAINIISCFYWLCHNNQWSKFDSDERVKKHSTCGARCKHYAGFSKSSFF